MHVLLQRITYYTYCALFLLTPLLMTPWNYELFEFNKMLFVYLGATLVGSTWLLRMTFEKRVIFTRTVLDVPIVLFVAVHIISAVHSIDPHVSIWGYYGRFNGGVLSLVSYIVLFYGFVSTVRTKHTELLMCSLISGVLVSIYAIAQRLGIDAHIWVQDVQSRVFSTLGQPNWLAAFVIILIPISFSYALLRTLRQKKATFIPYALYLLPVIYYITLLFTKSRSGFLAFWIIYILYSIIVYFFVRSHKPHLASYTYKLTTTTHILITSCLAAVILTVSIGSPFPQINRLISITSNSEPSPLSEPAEQAQSSESSELTTLNITDSGDIRKLVWRGAYDAARARPLFGWGPETFAWAYYQYRPVEHNLTSEWDFLYNKAHNEYLNYAATIGFTGLAAYLLIIGVFSIWTVIHMRKLSSHKKQLIIIGLFAGWATIHITNFFGFSVVITSLYFWLIPAGIISLFNTSEDDASHDYEHLDNFQKAGAITLVILTTGLIVGIAQYWFADYFYAQARREIAQGDYATGSRYLFKSLALVPYEPTYHSYLTNALAPLAVATYAQEANQESPSEEYASSDDLIQQAFSSSDISLQLSPGNVTFWKTRTRMFYTLSEIDSQYAKDSLTAVLKTQSLAPNDPAITYNVGIVYELNDDTDAALNEFKKALELKPNYKDAAWALAIFYEQEDNQEEADTWLRYILENIDPNDAEVKKKLGILE